MRALAFELGAPDAPLALATSEYGDTHRPPLPAARASQTSYRTTTIRP